MASSLLKKPCAVVSGLEHAKGVVVTRHPTPYRITAAGHTNHAERLIRKTHRNLLEMFSQQPAYGLLRVNLY